MCIKTLFLAIGTFCFDFVHPVLKVGDLAPDFSLADQAGTVHTLSAYHGKKVALCFYPKDDTPGCTAQMCSLRDGWSELQAVGVVVFGINFDSQAKHAQFAKQQGLSFPILSDADKKVGNAYGVKQWGLPIPKRITFLVSGEGKITHVIDKVDTKNHAQQILKLVQ